MTLVQAAEIRTEIELAHFLGNVSVPYGEANLEDIKEHQSYANYPKHEAQTMHGDMTKKRELMQGETPKSAKSSKVRGQSFQ